MHHGSARHAGTGVFSLIAALLCHACGSSAPIVVRPGIEDLPYACPAPGIALQAGQVTDRRGYADGANIGFTQTGATNVKASLIADPTPLQLVRARVHNILSSCAAAAGGPLVLVDVRLVRFQLSERSSILTETLTAELAVHVRARSAYARPLGALDVAVQTRESAIDTTSSAPLAVEHALSALEPQLASELALLAEGWMAAGPALLEAPPAPSPPLATRIVARAQAISPALEAELFGERLRRAGLVAVELEVVLSEVGPPIAVRRDGASLRFVDGAIITALETRKAEERVQRFVRARPFGSTGPVAFGASRSADHAARSQAGAMAIDVAELRTVGDTLWGLLFFTSKSAPRAAPEALSLELVDPKTGYAERVTLPVEPP